MSLREEVLAYFEERFGIPKGVFEGYGFYERGNKLWIISRGVEKGLEKLGLRFTTAGMLLARKNKTVKPTTNALQLFGRYANHNYIELEDEEARDYVRGFDLRCVRAVNATRGYVVVKYKGKELGCGFLEEKGYLRNLLPKARRLELEDFSNGI